MKALDLLYNYLELTITMDDPTEDIDEAIEELLLVQQEIDNLTEANKDLLECLQYTQAKLEMLL